MKEEFFGSHDFWGPKFLTVAARFGFLPARAARHVKAPVAQLDRASDYGSEG